MLLTAESGHKLPLALAPSCRTKKPHLDGLAESHATSNRVPADAGDGHEHSPARKPLGDKPPSAPMERI